MGDEQFDVISARIEALKERAETVSGQRSAFTAIGAEIFAMIGQEADADLDSRLRESARNASGLSLFPSQTKADGSSDQTMASSAAPVPDERLLDVEIVAMYW
ncbi:hypothetical protein LJR255_000935 [Pararhizobium sp. LjRoot255]|uniref:hypothetical protein n=1 Tax=Pararhizobium sp. LjRoot255 TaxID=3342298 RepID=UPI003ECECC6D